MNEFGTDALRYTLLTGSTPGNDMNLSLQRVEANRNFANKIWNAGRFVVMTLSKTADSPGDPIEPTSADRWIRGRLATLIEDVDRLFASYQYGEAGRQIYGFFWSEYADWYLEIAKLQVRQGGDRAWNTAKILVEVLDACLRMLHPFTPFVTEELWGKLKSACIQHGGGFGLQEEWHDALIVAQWPQMESISDSEKKVMHRFDSLMDVVRAIRNARSEQGISPETKIAVTFNAGSMESLFIEHKDAIASLAGIDQDRMDICETLTSSPTDTIPLVVGRVEAYLSLEGAIDVEAERSRLKDELQEIEVQIKRLEGLLAGPFSERAPGDVVQKERDKLQDFRQSAEKINEQMERFAEK
jgi:valyl-tRNA synthetase